MPPVTRDPWDVLTYETQMYWGTRECIDRVNRLPEGHVLRNAVVESLVLHTRILAEILISKGTAPDDIRLNELLPDWCTGAGKPLLERLKQAYGSRSKQGSPCWTFNKMLAHGTMARGLRYDYSLIMNTVEPLIYEVLQEIAEATHRKHLFPYSSRPTH